MLNRKKKDGLLKQYNDLLIEQLEIHRQGILVLTDIVKNQQKEIEIITQKHNELVEYVLNNKTEES